MSQPAKVLLLYAHPESQDSVANRVLLKPATQLSNVTVHDLYAHYPDFFIDIPREQYDLSGHCHFNPYQYPALYLGHGCDNDDIVPFYCDTVFSSILGETKNTSGMSFREISEEEFMAEFDRYAKELRDTLLIGNSTMEEQE